SGRGDSVPSNGLGSPVLTSLLSHFRCYPCISDWHAGHMHQEWSCSCPPCDETEHKDAGFKFYGRSGPDRKGQWRDLVTVGTDPITLSPSSPSHHPDTPHPDTPHVYDCDEASTITSSKTHLFICPIYLSVLTAAMNELESVEEGWSELNKMMRKKGDKKKEEEKEEEEIEDGADDSLKGLLESIDPALGGLISFALSSPDFKTMSCAQSTGRDYVDLSEMKFIGNCSALFMDSLHKKFQDKVSISSRFDDIMGSKRW
ncbi:hypothetical protein ADUPG1_008800, partial [Aduncisulcus paluster]